MGNTDSQTSQHGHDEEEQQHYNLAEVTMTELISDFEKGKLIGCGGAGSVFNYTHIKTQTKLAIKEISITNYSNNQEEFDNRVQKIQDECSKLDKIKHPNIAQYYFHFLSKSSPDEYTYYIAMPLLRRTLAANIDERIEYQQPYSSYDIMKIIKQLASALAYLEKNGIANKDIKPDNIMQNQHQNWVLVDFGAIKQSSAFALNSSSSLTIGSLPYASPEQLKSFIQKTDENSIDSIKSDVFSFGVIILQLMLLCKHEKLNGLNRLDQTEQSQEKNSGEKKIEELMTEFNQKKFSAETLTIVEECLKFNPQERPSFIQLDENIKKNKYKNQNTSTSNSQIPTNLVSQDKSETVQEITSGSTTHKKPFIPFNSITPKIKLNNLTEIKSVEDLESIKRNNEVFIKLIIPKLIFFREVRKEKFLHMLNQCGGIVQVISTLEQERIPLIEKDQTINYTKLVKFSKFLYGQKLVQKLYLNFRSSENFTDTHLQELAKSIKSLQQLNELSLGFRKNITFKDQGLINFGQQICGLDNLKYLSLAFLWNNNFTDKGLKPFSESLSHLKNLTKLELYFNLNEKFGSEGLKALGKSFEQLSELEIIKINLASNKIFSESSLESFGESLKSLLKLTKLTLSLNQNRNVTDDILRIFGNSLKQLQQLTSLSIDLTWSQKVSDTGFQYFFESIKQLTKLERLALDFSENNKVTKLGLNYISQAIPYFNELQEISLNFKQNKQFTAEGIDDLANTIKNCERLNKTVCDFNQSYKETLVKYESWLQRSSITSNSSNQKD